MPSRLAARVRWPLSIVLMLTSAWTLAALYFSPLSEIARLVFCGAFLVLVTAAYLWRRSWRLAAAVAAVLFGVVLVGWWTLPASNEGAWQADAQLLASVEFDGDSVRVKNIRDFIYTGEFDYRPRYANETYRLSELRAVDLFLVHWGSPAIAHTIVSFGFADGRQLAVSIETRKRIGQEYSAIRGFFRMYTMMYVVATERDVIRLRTNLRKEDVYLYRLRASPEFARRMFLQYAAHINRLYAKAEWYNALTENCTTSIRNEIYAFMPNQAFDWRLLLNGYIDEMLYERGSIDTRLPFDELKRRSYINPRAQVLPESADFSRGIRDGMPGSVFQGS